MTIKSYTKWTEQELKNEIIYRSNQLWEDGKKLSEDERLIRYIRELNDLEVEYIRVFKEPMVKHEGTLVLLVGDTIEPLLLSVRLWEPKSVILVVNSEYIDYESGETRHALVKRLIQQLPEIGDRVIVEDYVDALDGDEPANVFAHLQRLIHDRKGVMIDITGSKKSMIAGAFLYGAYYGAEISYVDFSVESYNAERRRPYGYGCEPKRLENPYGEFALREWENVKALYESFSFHAAMKVVDSIKKQLHKHDGLGSIRLESISKITHILEMYHSWDNGDHQQAAKIADEYVIPLGVERSELPPMVALSIEHKAPDTNQTRYERFLKEEPNWKGNRENASKVFAGLVRDHARCWAYVQDELERCRRLINTYEDYRMALIRAASLSEILIAMRLELLAPLVAKNGQMGDPSLDDLAFKERWILLQNNQVARKGRDADRWEIREPGPSPQDPRLTKYWRLKVSLTQNSVYTLINNLAYVRNDVVHGAVRVTATLANNALEIAMRNVTDFRQWMDSAALLKVSEVPPMPWSRVCKLCGLDHRAGVK